MLAAAKKQGFYEHYSGRRVGFKGSRFTIQEATLFNVSAPTGARLLG
jgi:MEKHLA domain